MSKIRSQWLLRALLVLLAVSATAPLRASGPIDGTLFTTYTITTDHTSVSLTVCGSVQQAVGCFGSGSMGPFGKVGALLEGNPSTNLTTGTVTRLIYVLDIAAGSLNTGVTLYVYKKTDLISSTFDTVTVTLSKTVSLSLTGGTTALASMAANSKFLFIGTNKSSDALKVQKSNYTITPIFGFSPPVNVTAITSDKYGYVTVTFGSFSGPENGFIVFDANGNSLEDGGGASFMLNTDQAVLPSTFH